MIIGIVKKQYHLIHKAQSTSEIRVTMRKFGIVRQITVTTNVSTYDGEENNIIKYINISIYQSHDLETQGAVKMTLDLI